jgi:FkbM family methyltransferase
MTRSHSSEKKTRDTTGSSVPEIFFNNGFCRGKQTRHGYMLYNPNDFIGQTLDVYGEWSYAEIELLAQLIKPGFVILDVGAYIGTHSVSFAKLVQPCGFVFSFEPQRIAFEFLSANIILNNLTNIFPMHAAVSDTNGEIMVPVINPASQSNTAAFKISGHTMGDAVKQVTIDSLGFGSCHMIKIDVEGMESNVIAGAQNTIRQFRPVLFLENNGFGNSPELIRQIFDLNYKAWWFFSPPVEPNTPFNPEINDKNMLCLPAEWNTNVNGLVPVLDANDTGINAYQRFLASLPGPGKIPG